MKCKSDHVFIKSTFTDFLCPASNYSDSKDPLEQLSITCGTARYPGSSPGFLPHLNGQLFSHTRVLFTAWEQCWLSLSWFSCSLCNETLPCLVGLKNSYLSCNTQLQSFSVKASPTAFPTLTRMTTPLYLAYPECYSSASTCLCVTSVYCTYVIIHTALDHSAFLPWLQCQPPEVRH